MASRFPSDLFPNFDASFTQAVRKFNEQQLALIQNVSRNAALDAIQFSELNRSIKDANAKILSLTGLSTSSALADAMKAFQPPSQLQEMIQNSMKMGELAVAYQKAFIDPSANLMQAIDKVLGVQKDFSASLSRSLAPLIGQVARDLFQATEPSEQAPSFAGELLQEIARVEEAEDELDRSNKLAALWKWLLLHIPQGATSTAAREALLNLSMIVLTFVLHYQSTMQMNRMEDRLDKIEENQRTAQVAKEDSNRKIFQRLDQLREEISEAVPDSPPPTETTTKLVVKRRLRLHTKPDARSRTICRIDAGSFLLRLGSHKRWIEIEFFDYGTGEPRSGWVFGAFVEPASVNSGVGDDEAIEGPRKDSHAGK